MTHEQATINTNDGQCPVHVFTPGGAGPWPGLLFFMDGVGIRPSLLEMGQRLADTGYVVLLPDLYYRAGSYGPFVPKELFSKPNFREILGPLQSTTDNRRAAEDSRFFLDYLAARPDVSGPKLGVAGYCMSGAMALAVAAAYPDRIGAAASFHGGNLANDTELSSHLGAPSIKGRVYIAAAENDPFYPPEMAARLEKALTDAGVDYRAETYEGAQHGWTMTDFPSYNAAADERHVKELKSLLDATLK